MIDFIMKICYHHDSSKMDKKTSKYESPRKTISYLKAIHEIPFEDTSILV